ncbi:hypothetical protein Enr13x_39360 [Stieleria neptunia]|uniref:Flavinylation-associated cytochrome domain-containing protein n=1 Tax=Stieleria neptunia TaxID=2527979 RepID=A0A518HT89_9BACT|nr:DUF4405 domain-containing protein [Stieleria neptunia]QDV44075.1 hypothetical protein Enr13x_39360 [Stieleria neptunia]
MSIAHPSNKAPTATRPTTVAVQRPFSVRGFTSIVLVLGMLMMLTSGLALYLAPRGRVAHATSWTAISLGRQQWAAVHINASLLFGVAASAHVVMNGSRLVGYIKKRAALRVNMKRELACALAVAGVVLAGTILGLAPISFPAEFKYELRDAWEPRIEHTSTPQIRRSETPPVVRSHPG